MTAIGAIGSHLMGIVDASVEIYLEKVIAPFLKLHEQFYAALNKVLRETVDKKGPLPKWCTANFITYSRTAVVVPAVLLLAAGHRWVIYMYMVCVCNSTNMISQPRIKKC